MNDENSHDDLENSPQEDPVYLLDPETEELVMTALSCMVTLADAQVTKADGDALIIIADTLASRFAIDKFEVVETVHTDSDTGDEEIIYTPLSGSILPDDELDDDETFH